MTDHQQQLLYITKGIVETFDIDRLFFGIRIVIDSYYVKRLHTMTTFIESCNTMPTAKNGTC